MIEHKRGDRLRITNVAGVTVVGICTRPYDGVFGHVDLADGTDWTFACDAKVEQTDDPVTGQLGEYRIVMQNPEGDTIGPVAVESGKPVLTPGLHLHVRPELAAGRQPAARQPDPAPESVGSRTDMRGRKDQRKIAREQIFGMLDSGKGVTEICRTIGCSKTMGYRCQREWKAGNQAAPGRRDE